MAVERQREHRWLERLAGDWTWEMEAEGDPGEPPVRDAGTEHVRSLEGVWILCESAGRMPDGSTATSIMTLGYDPAKARFVGTFFGSMMTYLWIYEGTLEGDTLTLDAEGPSYTEEGTMARYRDTIELVGDDRRIQRSSYQREDGSWHAFMTNDYRRVL